MIVVTGAAGFIGSRIIHRLLELDSKREIIAVDLPGKLEKTASNLHGYSLSGRLNHFELISDWFDTNAPKIEAVIHMGACSDTTAPPTVVNKLNLHYSMQLWEKCAQHKIELIYASSAAVYGDGSDGFDDTTNPRELRPLNPYGESKQLFDVWTHRQPNQPPRWYGLRFFNVFGPHEALKGKMSSMAYKMLHSIADSGYVELFESERSDYEDGEQARDFIYVDDVVDIVLHFRKTPCIPVGQYNVGTGVARTFNSLAQAAFREVGRPVDIRYLAIPDQIKWRYQYYTKAVTEKLRSKAMYETPFTTLEDGVKRYAEWLHIEDWGT